MVAEKKKPTISIPRELKNHKFIEIFKEWVDYRKNVIKKPLKESTIQRQLKKLASWGVEKAIMALDTAMDNQWQGFFEPTIKKKRESFVSDDAYDRFKRQARKNQEMNLQPEVAQILSRIGKKA
jgi:hypothetical protein